MFSFSGQWQFGDDRNVAALDREADLGGVLVDATGTAATHRFLFFVCLFVCFVFPPLLCEEILMCYFISPGGFLLYRFGVVEDFEQQKVHHLPFACYVQFFFFFVFGLLQGTARSFAKYFFVVLFGTLWVVFF